MEGQIHLTWQPYCKRSISKKDNQQVIDDDYFYDILLYVTYARDARQGLVSLYYDL